MEENKDLNTENSSPDSNDSNCCDSNAGGSGKFKSIIFILVLLAACAVAAHAIIAKNGASDEKSACRI